MIEALSYIGRLRWPGCGVTHGARSNRYATAVRARLCGLLFLQAIIAPAYAAPDPAHSPNTVRVGPERTLKTPSDAARVARAGDTVEIDAGLYLNDYAEWTQPDLTIRGMGGMAHLQSTELIPNGKAIWIVSGNNTVIENVEFSGARVADGNGAGIRHQGGNLSLRNTFFHHNEFSVLTGADPNASLDIQSSRFWFQKRPNTFSHGIYVGALKRFTLMGSHIKGTDRGHQLKSRALENYIFYNRIEDLPEGNASRLVDLSNCGLSFIIGNDLHQAITTQNGDAIGYGAEGCEGRSKRQHSLFVINNTFVNEAWNGTLVRNHANGDVLVANNLIFGRANILLGNGEKLNNVALSLNQRLPGSWDPPAHSVAIDSIQAVPGGDGFPLVPTREFAPPVGTVERKPRGALDIGSREQTSRDAAGHVSQ